MQKGYRYELSATVGRAFDPDFRPELTPRDMLGLGVFCGKYMTDCRDEFPKSWFAGARLASGRRDCSLNYFGVDASQPLSVWRGRAGSIQMTRAAGSSGTAATTWASDSRGGRATDPALEGHAPAHPPDRAQLRARRPLLPPPATPELFCTGPTTAARFDGRFSKREPQESMARPVASPSLSGLDHLTQRATRSRPMRRRRTAVCRLVASGRRSCPDNARTAGCRCACPPSDKG